MELISGILEQAKRQDVDVLCFLGVHNGPAYKVYFGEDDAYNFDYQFNCNYDNLAMTQVDALIIDENSMAAYMSKEEQERFLQKFSHIPFVLVGNRDQEHYASSIVFDCYIGMCQITRHLALEHGYKHFCYLSGPMNNRDSIERLRAVKNTLQVLGIPLQDHQIAEGDFTRMVDRHVCKLLDDNPLTEALICANDYMATSAYRVCKQRGLEVGKDIAITGYDDWENADLMDPPLTTVKQNDKIFGIRALQSAITIAHTGLHSHVKVPVELRLRASCGCHNKTHHTRIMSFQQEERVEKLKLQTWFVSLIPRNMMTMMEDSREFYRTAVEKLGSFGVQDSWMFLYPQPVEHKRGSRWTPPANQRLVAQQHGEHNKAWTLTDAPVLDCIHTIESYCENDKQQSLIVLCLYSGEMQYGTLVVNVQPQDLALTYLMSIQIANALHYFQMFLEQKRMHTTLENLVAQIKEKNEVLNYLSEYDPLTGCYNRRGFMERAISAIHGAEEQQAVLLFADLDHLKEINDCFGHTEGDFAIRKASSILNDELGGEHLLGRVGGDEFVALIMTNSGEFAQGLRNRISNAFAQYNHNSDKPYFVSMSLGVKPIVCNVDMSLIDALKQADEALYVAKRNRRPSVRKAPQQIGNLSNGIQNTQVNPLTGLYMSHVFFRNADSYIKKVNAADFCMVAIDIVNFKLFNKWYGRSEGDKLLAEIGRLLREIQQENSGVAGYLGGDNFAILMPDNRDLLEDLRRSIQRAVRHLGRSSGYVPAMGVYRFNYRIMSAINMYDCALVALANGTGKRSTFIEYYDYSMFIGKEYEQALLADALESLQQQYFSIRLQPQCEIDTGRIIGAEALARWEHPIRGEVPPSEFVPVLEKTHFIADLDRYVWRRACSLLRSCMESGKNPVPISVNISRLDFFLMDVPGYLQQLMKQYGLPAKYLKVEITESAYAEDASIRESINKIREMGINVMLDDFGSGYSSMSVLHNLQLDFLKFDMQFLHSENENKEKGRRILDTLVHFAKQLGIPSIVEGVETQQHVNYLREIGCHYAQGFFFHKPMNGEDFLNLLD